MHNIVFRFIKKTVQLKKFHSKKEDIQVIVSYSHLLFHIVHIVIELLQYV